MVSKGTLLLHNGTVLIHDDNNHVIPRPYSVLISDGEIAKISQSIVPPDGCEVIDCTDKIISPGFIDTHHHGWQTQLKGRHANEQLLEYMVAGKPKITCETYLGSANTLKATLNPYNMHPRTYSMVNLLACSRALLQVPQL